MKKLEKIVKYFIFGKFFSNHDIFFLPEYFISQW